MRVDLDKAEHYAKHGTWPIGLSYAPLEKGEDKKLLLDLIAELRLLRTAMYDDDKGVRSE